MRYSLLLILFLLAPAQARTLHLTTGFTPPVSDFFQRVLQEADRRMPDIRISFEVLPAERSLALVEQGINDGDCCRIPEFIFNNYSNMVKVPTSFHSVRWSVFTKKSDVSIRTFADLKPWSVGTVKGWVAAVDNLEAIQPAQLHVVTRPEQLFRMLQQDRIDFGVMGHMSGMKALRDLKLSDVHALEPPLMEKQLYLLLARKHRSLVPVFTRVFDEMIEDGTIDAIYRDITMNL